MMKWSSTGSLKAFTLIECLVALGVLALAVLMMTPIMTTTQRLSNKLEIYGEQELEVALIQLEYEMEQMTFHHFTSDSFFFCDQEGNQAEFRLVNGTFIKRLNGGYHPLLTKVKQVAVEQVGPSLLVTFTFLDGRVRYGKVIIATS